MIVVADTSPLNYLILIEHIDVLASLYSRIAIPSAVHEEMLRPKAPAAVQFWANNHPAWVEVHASKSATHTLLEKLDRGESEAISLALAIKAPILMIDEVAGRKEAQFHGLRVIGTLGVLRDAHALGLLDLRTAIQRLQATNFHVPLEILGKLLAIKH